MTIGAAWMVLVKFLERGLGVVSTLILARLLVPADFGLVAMAMSVIALLELFGAFGFDVALIRQEDANREHYDTAWTFNALVGVFIALCLLALAHPVASFYREERVVPVVSALALGSLVQGFENIGVVAFRKELNFRKEFIFIGGKKLVMFATTIPLAFLLRNYWALVAGTVVGRFAGVALSYFIHPFRPKFSVAKRADLFGFSKWVFVVNFLYFIRERATDFVIGRMVGPAILGIYTIGYEISNLPTTELVAPINRAVYPGYAKLASKIDELREEYLAVIGLIAFLSMPAAAGISSIADLMVPVLLGDKWLTAIPVIQILAYYGMVQALQSNTYAIYLAIGKPYLPARINTLLVIILLTSLLLLTPEYQLLGAVWAILGTALFMTPINLGIAFRQLNLHIPDFLRVVNRPLLGSLAMYLTVRALVSNYLADVEGVYSLLALLLAVLAGASSYAFFVGLLWVASGRPDGAEKAALNRVRAWRKGSA